MRCLNDKDTALGLFWYNKIMKIRKFLIAEGNATALVFDCPDSERINTSKNLLKSVEQVGFIEDTEPPELTMMGGELCINGTIALASTLQKAGQLKTSGLQQVIDYENNGAVTTLNLTIPYKLEGDEVLFNGIGYIVSQDLIEKIPTKKELLLKCQSHNLPAYGYIQLKDNKITPYIYVQSVDSLVEETACGSGSIAASIASGISEIIQPTGKSIIVKLDNDNRATISAVVQEIS